ncbi:Flp pilus assembly protein TadD, contains TPR repeats [Myroides odoratus]|uniref:Flp pilus assembly protein TadD, contains TPR repeats n=2 Tax=Myroides odoratus TaxID=256 RepID=A0A378U1T7_MYROD|nr:tetratricopeptide repeat protein [Myroides odoratus]STZ69225.1 Flp pilus assembly protein TadD, contains TPR repeats [Myroides odoratus]
MLIVSRKMKHIYLTFGLVLFASLSAWAQSAGRALTVGNETYEHKQFTQAEAAYRIASSKSDKKETPTYNLGNSLIRQKQNKEAISAYNKAIKEATTKTAKHQAYHNLGNAYMAEKNYKAAEQAYKNALRNNPKDDETRYNYAVAKKLNEENPQDDQNKDNQDQDNQDNQQNQDKNQDQNQDKNQDDNKQNDKGDDKKDDKKDQGDNKDNKDDKNDKDNKDNKDQNKDQKPNPQQQKQQQSKEQMERILDAVNRDEQAVQQRLIDKNKKGDKKGEAQGVSTQRKKDW